MFDHLGPAMRRALAAVRASNPMEATRVLQDALNGRQSQPTAADGTPGGGRNGAEPGLPRLRGLGDTLSALRRGVAAPQLRRKHQPQLPPGSAFLKRRIVTAEGARDFWLFVPSSPGVRGLVVMLHGCRQSGDDFAVGTTMNQEAEKEHMLVAYPTQPQAANAMGCWNWFRPEDQQRDRGEPHIIAEMTRAISAEYGLGQKVFVAGLSAGGAMAAVMGASYPDLYEAVGIHSGLPYRAASDVNSALAAMRGTPPTGTAHSALTRQIVFHGTGDRTVTPTNAGALMQSVQAAYPAAEPRKRRFMSGSQMVTLVELVEPDGTLRGEAWYVDGAGHHWIGGDPAGSFAKPEGPGASREMMRFFLGRRHE